MPRRSKTSAASIFVILGYGVPRNILRDDNYSRYLALVFNTVFAAAREQGEDAPLVVFCGGHTDCCPPFKRTEADEMRRAFKRLMRRKSVARAVKGWRLVAERKSLSTLENLLHLRIVLGQYHGRPRRVIVFCEYTRHQRIRTLSKKILKERVRVVPIDFDQSPNRSLPLNFLRSKERAGLRHSLRALQSQPNLKKHHALFQQKLNYFRKNRTRGHANVVYDWWSYQLKNFNE